MRPHPDAGPTGGDAEFGCAERRAIYAHRGACGYRPEHTAGAYELAIEQGADVIEPDLVMTGDGVLVVRHENEIGSTTDVATHTAFAGRRTSRTIDGTETSGWFCEDFTLAELRTLRAVERLPELRPDNTAYNNRWPVMTFEEVIGLARAGSARSGRTIGLAPEIKHSGHMHSLGLDPEAEIVRILDANGLGDERAPVIVQSFEVGNLRRLDTMTGVRLVQLLGPSGGPADSPGLDYAQMASPEGLAEIAAYADAVAPEVTRIVPRDERGRSLAPSTFVADAHAAGLPVIAWTLRRENAFLAAGRRSPDDDPAAAGDLDGTVEQLLALGVDGVFTDNPDIAVAARDRFERHG